MAAALARLAADDVLLTRLGDTGPERLHRVFSPERMAWLTRDIYEETLHCRS